MNDREDRMEAAKVAAAELGIDKPDPLETAYHMTNKYFYDLRYGEEDKKRAAGRAGVEEGEKRDQETAAEEELQSVPRDIAVITDEILFYKVQAGRSFLEIGRRLNEAKAQLSHGEWLPWLKEKVDISERTAQRFMQLSNEYGKSAILADLGASKALQLLALPESEREDFAAEKHAVDGQEKTVGEMTSKELAQAVRERDAALTAQKQAEDALSGAQAERDALSVKSAGLEEKLRRTKEREKNAKFAEEQADAAKRRAEKALKELREKPVDVAVAEPDQVTLDKLRADAENAAAEKVRQAEEQLQAARKKAEDAAAEADAMKKRLAIADPLTTEFQVYFNDWQKVFGTMTLTLGKITDEGKRGKLRHAIRAAAERMMGEVQ